MITDSDKHWLAGVLDARGSLLWSDNRRVNIGLSMQMKDDDRGLVIDKVALMLGLRTRPSFSIEGVRHQCAEHCPEPHIHYGPESKYKRLTLGGYKFIIIVDELRPYLVRDYSRQYEALQDVPRMRRVALQMKRIGWNVDMDVSETCVAPGCDRTDLHGHGLCNLHYLRSKGGSHHYNKIPKGK